MHSVIDYISNVLGIPKEIASDCSSFYVPKKFSKGEFVLQQGEVCEGTYFVNEGLLRMYSLDKHGKEHIIQFAPENWLISDRSSQFFNEKSRYYIDAVEDTKCSVLRNDFFESLHKIYPEKVEANLVLLQRHIYGLQNRVNSLLSETAEERYLEFLRTYPDIMQRVPQWMVASYLGITPESLSRVRKELALRKYKIE